MDHWSVSIYRKSWEELTIEDLIMCEEQWEHVAEDNAIKWRKFLIRSLIFLSFFLFFNECTAGKGHQTNDQNRRKDLTEKFLRTQTGWPVGDNYPKPVSHEKCKTVKIRPRNRIWICLFTYHFSIQPASFKTWGCLTTCISFLISLLAGHYPVLER